MNERLIDQMVKLHMANGTDPHPPRNTDDKDYCQAYDVVIHTLAVLRRA